MEWGSSTKQSRQKDRCFKVLLNFSVFRLHDCFTFTPSATDRWPQGRSDYLPLRALLQLGLQASDYTSSFVNNSDLHNFDFEKCHNTFADTGAPRTAFPLGGPRPE